MRSRLGDPRALPIRNLSGNPRAVAPVGGHWAGYAGVGGAAAVSAGSDVGGTFARITWTTSPTTPSGGIYIGSSAIGRVPVTAGRRYFASMKIRSSVDQVVTMSAEQRTASDEFAASGIPVATVTLKAGIWRYVSGWFTPGPTTDRVTITAYALSTTGSTIWPVGATLDATEGFVAQTDQRPMFADGDSPSSRWEGKANASTSIGYPNLSTLDSIAGPPAAQIYGTGSIWNTIPGEPLDPITVYFCFHSIASSAAHYPSFAQFGGATTGTGRLTLQSGATGSDDVRVRFDTGNGSANVVVPVAGSRLVPGTHVMVGRMPAGLTAAFTSFDGGDEGTKSIAPGDGIPRTMLNVSGSTSNELVPLWTVAYNADHPKSTRDAITAWLKARS
ncbi:hypothetical protein GS982_31410 [Rhodococcus hoagii]|nr:hypothetical protein [Prescottella equi]NKZ84522.1 hypothetical protein [Prescottella equi]NKZ86502.1 hypothetical protein [Prescottella equi]